MTTTKPRRSQSLRSSRRTYADTIWARKIKERDGVCAMCGEPGDLDAAHFFRRSILSTRWTPENGAAMHRDCHRSFDLFEFDRWMWISRRLGEKRLNALREKARQPWDKDYDRVHRELKEWRP